MIICICNNISSGAVARDPALLGQCGSQCGTCVLWLESTEGQQFTQQFATMTPANGEFFTLAVSGSVED